MANLPDSLYEDYTQLRSTWSTGSSSPPAPTVVSPPNLLMVLQWINDLHSPMNSDFALQNLATNRYNFEMLPKLLWDSTGTLVMLLQEVVRLYQFISLPVFYHSMRVRAYNVLLLFQCIAHYPETRHKFIRARMPYYFYPLMDIVYTDMPRECIRIGALGVIAHMLKAPREEAAIRFLMDSGALGYCKRPIEIGSTNSKTLAVYILNKIMSTSEGLQYCCVLADRFFVIDDLLKKLLVYLSSMDIPDSTLFKFVTACYLKLSNKSRAREGIREYLPVLLFDGRFARLLAEDPVANNHRNQLIQNLENRAM